MYNPYANAADSSYAQLKLPQNLQHPRPQHAASFSQGNNFQQQQLPPQQQGQQFQGQQFQGQQFQGQQFQQQPSGGAGPYLNFFSDPTASMAAQFAKSSFGQSNQYLQQNFGGYIPLAGELKYYFKVSNSYVWRKLILILFPYRHQNWTRMTTADTAGSSGAVSYAPPSEDVNAPDLYIPLMSFVTYILLWSIFQGLKGDFHPEVFGYLASQTLACSFVDILIFKVGLYLLNCSTQSSLWDLISFSGYKYVSIIVLLCCKNMVTGSSLVFYGVMLVVVSGLALFLMRSLKFLILPLGAGESSANTISNGQRRLRVQFLFIYSAVVQFLIILFMSR